MNSFSISSVIALAIFFLLAYIVYFRNPKGAVNRIFVLFCLSMVYFAFIELGLRQANGYESARIWMQAFSFWPLCLATFVHFSLVLTQGPRLLLNKLTCALLYIPALVIAHLELGTDYITKGPVEKFWGWTYQFELTPAFAVVLSWAAVMAIIATYVCWSTYFKTPAGQSKTQAKFVAMGISIPVVFGVGANMLLPLLDIKTPEGITFPAAVGGVFIGYAIWKHELFAITPGTAAENILSIMSDFLFLVNGQGLIVTINSSALKALGYEEAELKGREFISLFPGENENMNLTSKKVTPLAGLIAVITEQARETTIITKTGEHISVSIATSTITDNDGNLQGFACIARDMTWYKEAQDKLLGSYEREIELRQNLEKEIAKRIEFTRTLVHELKTPLTPMLAASQLLTEEVQEETLYRLAENIRQGSQALSKRIDELLDVAKGELGMLELKLRRTDLLPLFRRIIDDMGPMTAAQGHLLISDLPPYLPPVLVDEIRIMQVLNNLLTNAFKFTPRGGKITLKATSKDDILTVEIRDTGIGIATENLHRIFDAYYQAESSRKYAGGLGIGLALCKTIIERHGGEIWVESELGNGSTFGFSIPVSGGVNRNGGNTSDRESLPSGNP